MLQPMIRLLLFFLIAFGASVFDRPAYAKAADEGAIAEKVMQCFKDGIRGDKKITIKQMQTCSGYWVTPRALLQCAMGARCSVFSDNLEGRVAFRATLQALNLAESTELGLNKDRRSAAHQALRE
jgi:hypothetical protein